MPLDFQALSDEEKERIIARFAQEARDTNKTTVDEIVRSVVGNVEATLFPAIARMLLDSRPVVVVVNADDEELRSYQALAAFLIERQDCTLSVNDNTIQIDRDEYDTFSIDFIDHPECHVQVVETVETMTLSVHHHHDDVAANLPN